MTFSLSPEEIAAIANQVAEIVIARMEANGKADHDTLLTEREVAAVCRVEVSTVRLARRKGQLRCVRVGRFPRYRRPDVDQWLLSEGKPEGTNGILALPSVGRGMRKAK